MKNIQHYLLTLAVALQCGLFPYHSFAQDKQDVVIFFNGEKKAGKVVSGRVEVINAVPKLNPLRQQYRLGSSPASTPEQRKDDGQKKSTYTYDGGTSYTTASFDTKVTLNIYHDDGNSIYSNTREPAFGRLDSYQPALKYMLKRSPLAK